jgi:hypothetical protein
MRKKGENNIRCAGKIAIRLNENNDFKPDSRKSNIFRYGSIPGALTTYALLYDGFRRSRGFIVFVKQGFTTHDSIVGEMGHPLSHVANGYEILSKNLRK